MQDAGGAGRPAGSAGWPALVGGLGALLLAVWLFVPAALLIATLYIDRVAAAVDRRFYPGLPPAAGRAAGGAGVGRRRARACRCWRCRSLALVLRAGCCRASGWCWAGSITGWAIGRGLFVGGGDAADGRGRQALHVYARPAAAGAGAGAALALAGTVPLVNLLVPVLGMAP